MPQLELVLIRRTNHRLHGPCALCGRLTTDVAEFYTVVALGSELYPPGAPAPVCEWCRDREASDLANLAAIGSGFFDGADTERRIVAAVARELGRAV